jgi:transcription initiation factor TFIIF subunit alpha
VAQRATSPKAPKVGKTSRASSPLAQGSVSAQPNSRATSPVTESPNSPGAPAKVNGNKRKAGEEASAPSPPQNGAPKAKKRRGPGGAAGGTPAEELEDKAVIEWLRNTPNANTRDCIAHFKPYLTDEAKKTKFTALIKEAAQLKGGVLVLRSAYRGSPQQSPEPQS